MINTGGIKRYCYDDISLIENYDKAIEDNTQIWDCHHKLGELNSKKYLLENNLYYNRPANELIFIPHSEHSRLHNLGKPSKSGWHHTEESKQKIGKNHWKNSENAEEISLLLSEKLSKSLKGKKAWNKGLKMSEQARKKMSDAAKKRYENPEERKKTSEATKGRINTEQSRKKMSLAKLNTYRVYDNPEHTKWHMEKNK